MNGIRRLTAATCVSASMLMAACAPMRVRSFVPQEASLVRYQTYDWAEQADQPTGDPRLDANPFFAERIKVSTERELAARGFEKAASGRPDVLLHYHASISQKVDVQAADARYGYCPDCRGGSVYDAGTIMLDLIDGKTERLVWRAWAEATLEGVIDDQAWLDERVDDAIVRIVATLPRPARQ
jgi:hypothetical protein